MLQSKFNSYGRMTSTVNGHILNYSCGETFLKRVRIRLKTIFSFCRNNRMRGRLRLKGKFYGINQLSNIWHNHRYLPSNTLVEMLRTVLRVNYNNTQKVNNLLMRNKELEAKPKMSFVAVSVVDLARIKYFNDIKGKK